MWKTSLRVEMSSLKNSPGSGDRRVSRICLERDDKPLIRPLFEILVGLWVHYTVDLL